MAGRSALLYKIPVLLAALLLVGTSAAAQDRPRCPMLPDPYGDAGSIGQQNTETLPDDPSLDLRSVDMTSTREQLGMVVRVQKLGRTFHQAYRVGFTIGDTRFVVTADLPPEGVPMQPGFYLARAGGHSAEAPSGAGAGAGSSPATPIAGRADVSASRISFIVDVDLLSDGGRIHRGTRLSDVYGDSQRVLGSRVFAQSDLTETATYVFGSRGCVPMPTAEQEGSDRAVPEVAPRPDPAPVAPAPAAAPAAAVTRPPASNGPSTSTGARRTSPAREVRWRDSYGDARMTGELQPVQTFSREDLDILEMRFVPGGRGVSIEMLLLAEAERYAAYYGIMSDPTTGCELKVLLSGADSATVSCQGIPSSPPIPLPELADDARFVRAFVPYDAFPSSVSPDRALRVAGQTWSSMRGFSPPPPFEPGWPVPPTTVPVWPTGVDLVRHDVATTEQTLTRHQR